MACGSRGEREPPEMAGDEMDGLWVEVVNQSGGCNAKVGKAGVVAGFPCPKVVAWPWDGMGRDGGSGWYCGTPQACLLCTAFLQTMGIWAQAVLLPRSGLQIR